MAFKTSVKAVLLAQEPEPFRAPFAAPEPVPERPRLPDPIAPPSPPRAAPIACDWHARAAALRDAAPQVSSDATRSHLLAIAALYDELGDESPAAAATAVPAPDIADADLAAPAIVAADETPCNEPALAQAPPDEAAPPPPAAEAAPPPRRTFPRRPLPARRFVSLRG